MSKLSLPAKVFTVHVVWEKFSHDVDFVEDVASVRNGCVIAEPGGPSTFKTREAAEVLAVEVRKALRGNPNRYRIEVRER